MSAFLSDYLKHRFLFAVVPMTVAIAGFIVLLVTDHNTNLKYGALYLAACGAFTAMPVVLCWFMTNCKRPLLDVEVQLTVIIQWGAIAEDPLLLPGKLDLATVSLTSILRVRRSQFLYALAVGGIVAAYAFLAKDAPRYIPGYSLCIASICFSAASSCAYLIGCMWENRRREKGASSSEMTLEEKQQLGDLNPDYRYLL